MKKQKWQVDLDAATTKDDIKHGILLFMVLAFLYLLSGISSCGHIGGADTADGAALYNAAYQRAVK